MLAPRPTAPLTAPGCDELTACHPTPCASRWLPPGCSSPGPGVDAGMIVNLRRSRPQRRPHAGTGSRTSGPYTSPATISLRPGGAVRAARRLANTGRPRPPQADEGDRVAYRRPAHQRVRAGDFNWAGPGWTSAASSSRLQYLSEPLHAGATLRPHKKASGRYQT